MLLDDCMDRFITASRGLFNAYFRDADPWAEPHHAWDRRDLYETVERPMFRALVTVPCTLAEIPYGRVQTEISVCARGDSELPIMLNREINSGYWDYPLKMVTTGTRLQFLSFFDWSGIDRKDHRYVRAIVASSSDSSEIAGKHCLIETHYVRFERYSGDLGQAEA
jgi:hypothetical protein